MLDYNGFFEYEVSTLVFTSSDRRLSINKHQLLAKSEMLQSQTRLRK